MWKLLKLLNSAEWNYLTCLGKVNPTHLFCFVCLFAFFFYFISFRFQKVLILYFSFSFSISFSASLISAQYLWCIFADILLILLKYVFLKFDTTCRTLLRKWEMHFGKPTRNKHHPENWFLSTLGSSSIWFNKQDTIKGLELFKQFILPTTSMSKI